jgi:steroid delta-isomerase-like uncharacterized protein
MSAENKAVVRRWFEAFNRGDFNAGAQVLHEGHVLHAPGGDARGPEGWKEFARMYRTAFPDCELVIEELLADGDRVIIRFTARGTHGGVLAGIQATGRRVTVPSILICQVSNGKVIESWQTFDQLAMFQAIGTIPTVAASA